MLRLSRDQVSASALTVSIPTQIRCIDVKTYPSHPYQHRSVASIPIQISCIASIPIHIHRINTNMDPWYLYQYRSVTSIPIQSHLIDINQYILSVASIPTHVIRRIHTNTDLLHPYQHGSTVSISTQVFCIHTNTDASNPYQYGAIALRSRFLFQVFRIISCGAGVFVQGHVVHCSARLEFYWVYMEEK